MKIVLAPNAFKESLTATEAARAMRRGLQRALPLAELIEFPVADGGDGVAEVLRQALGGNVTRHRVTGPLGDAVEARLIRLKAATISTFVIEMAETSGLRHVPVQKRNPMKTTTRGLGELIRVALDKGAQRIVLGLGGSATVDGGAGMVGALGFGLLDAKGRKLPEGGGSLEKLDRIVVGEETERLAKVEFIGLCDVRNPLLGRRGAVSVFGAQKGASPTMAPKLERGLERLANCLRRDLRRSVARRSGAGAAGGLGAGLAGFLGAALHPGAEWILDATGFDDSLEGADWVLTGEGRLDLQTLEDKAPAVVARYARARGIPVIALAGSVDPKLRGSRAGREAFRACASVLNGPMTLADAQRQASRLVEQSAFEIGTLIQGRD